MKQNEYKEEWRKYVNDGSRYLKTAVNGSRKRKNVFTPEIVYNIVAISIEKSIMGYLLYNKSLPENHTLRDLVDAVRLIYPFEDDLFEKLVDMDRFQEICCIDLYHREIPNEDDIENFLNIGQGVQTFVFDQLALNGQN